MNLKSVYSNVFIKSVFLWLLLCINTGSFGQKIPEVVHQGKLLATAITNASIQKNPNHTTEYGIAASIENMFYLKLSTQHKDTLQTAIIPLTKIRSVGSKNTFLSDNPATMFTLIVKDSVSVFQKIKNVNQAYSKTNTIHFYTIESAYNKTIQKILKRIISLNQQTKNEK